MTTQEKELEIRARVKALRNFYRDAIYSALMSLGVIIIWAFSGGGYFWPIFVIVVFAISLIQKALDIGVFPKLTEILPFVDEKWEEQQVEALLKKKETKKEAAPSVAAPSSSEVKAAAIPTSAPKKKAASKKAPPKKASPKKTEK